MGFLDQMRLHGPAHLEIDHGRRSIIAVGDFEIVYERSSIIEARCEFLESVKRVVPEAFTELCEIAKDHNLETQGPRRAEWQQRWGLTAEWCRLAAFHTANAYPEMPPSFIYPEFQASGSFKPLTAPELPAFDPTRETWAEYERSCRRLLAEYRLQSYTAAERQKFQPVEDRRSLRMHLTWLAAYQCLGASISAIAEAADMERFAIDYGVKNTAKLIGLQLRPAMRSTLRGNALKSLVQRIVAALAE
jgi:hypothetical protein